MVAKVSSIYDDFNLPSVDVSKWQTPLIATQATMTFPTGVGLQWDTTTSNTAHSALISNTAYDMMGSSVFIRQSASFTETSTVAYFQVTRSSTGTTGDLFRCEILLRYSSGWVLEARVYNTSNVDVSASFIKGPRIVAYNSTAMRYWRHYRNSAPSTGMTTPRHYWQYSADGVTWTTLGYADNMSTMPSIYVRFGYGAGGGRWQIRRLNILKDIDRGVGYLYDDFRLYPKMTAPISTATTQFGLWKFSAAGTIVQSLDDVTSGNNAVQLTSTTAITSNNRSTIRDVDLSAAIRLTSGTATRLKWRIGSDGNSYWYLHITPTSAQFGVRISGTESSVGSAFTYSSITGTTQHWRIVHVGSEIVLISDVGVATTTPGSGYGSGGYGDGSYGGGTGTIVSSPSGQLVERGRLTNSSLLSPGNVGFSANSATVYIDDVKAIAGVIPPAPVGTTPSEPTQIKPWTGDRYMQASQYEYMRLEDDYGNTLNIAPSYGDIFLLPDTDLGSPEARSVTVTRPLASGVRSFTRFHGEKVVNLSLRCRKTVYQEAQYYVDLIQFWASPGKKSRLVFKPRGQNERFINIEGQSMGRPVATAMGIKRMDVNASFLCADGGDYETVIRSADLYPSISSFAQNTGGLDTEPVIRIYGPCQNPVIYQETIEGNYPGVRARLGLGSEDNPFILDVGEFVELRYDGSKVQWMAWKDDQASRRGDLTTRDWFTLKPGRNSLRLEVEVDSGGAYARVFWRNKY